MLGKISADKSFKYFSYFSKKEGFDISCKLFLRRQFAKPITGENISYFREKEGFQISCKWFLRRQFA